MPTPSPSAREANTGSPASSSDTTWPATGAPTVVVRTAVAVAVAVAVATGAASAGAVSTAVPSDSLAAFISAFCSGVR